MKYFCCDEQRVKKLKQRLDEKPPAKKTLNGIEFLEVVDDASIPADRRQRTLLVYFFSDKNLSTIRAANLTIKGGTRIKTVGIEAVHLGDAVPAGFLTAQEAAFLPKTAKDKKRLLVVRTDSNGDFSRYTFRVVADASEEDDEAPSDFDPILSAIEFLFKAGCPSEFDCATKTACPPSAPAPSNINYLAKDYASFRQLMLDRMALLVPSWQERAVPDIGVTLVEWLAAAGDILSYQQDAVSTEAYIGKARRRVSVRRHARLVDYHMHDGCNARAWIAVSVSDASTVTLKKHTPFLTRDPENPPCLPINKFNAKESVDKGRVIFEAMHDLVAWKAHSSMTFYTWGDSRCCLPAGATKATLEGNLPNLRAGQVVIFQEVKGSKSGEDVDADPTRRHPVMLTYALSHVAGDPTNNLKDPLFDKEITEIEWAAADALPFAFCISAVKADGSPIEGVTVALGNVILADQGATIEEDQVRDGESVAVPARREVIPPASGNRCEDAEKKWKYPRFNPKLAEKPLTMAESWPESVFFSIVPANAANFAAALTKKKLPAELKERFDRKGVSFTGRVTAQGSGPEWSISDGKRMFLIRRSGSGFGVVTMPESASQIASTDFRSAVPAVALEERSSGAEWKSVQDLLDSDDDDRDFAVEVEDDGTASIRFGDGDYGVRPDPGFSFKARYRVGNGTAGNVGAGSLVHIVTDQSGIAVTNPLPARGGVDRETIEEVRQKAPFAFRVQERAVTADDYAKAARKFPGVQNAIGTFRWTGSWHTVFLTIDRKGGLAIDGQFRDKLLAYIERYRLAGYDLVVDKPRYVSLQIDMRVCVKRGYFREDVKSALLEVFGNGRLADGRLAVFHPDQFTFAQPVYLSRIYEAALGVDGVQNVVVTRFQRQGRDESDARDAGRLDLGRLEIARLDNDPSFPDHGVLRLEMGGGQ